MSARSAAIDAAPVAPAARAVHDVPRARPCARRPHALCLWWELLAGPGPRWLRLLRWAQRNCRD